MKRLVLNNVKIGMLMIAVLLGSTAVMAQTGINTRNPIGVLHVDGAKDNPVTGVPTAAQAQNDFIVTNTGFIGVGVINPLVKLDLRSAGTKNAFGLGNTTMTAPDAGMGAMRYHTPDEKIQVSDGVQWDYTYIPPVKAVVVARMANPFTVNRNTNVNITGWDEVRDMANNFDPVSGEFRAPRDGVYTFLMTFNFVTGPIVAGSRVEVQFVNSSGTVLGRSYKTFGKSHRDTQAGGSATVTLKLTAGTTVRPRMWHNITSSGGRALRTHADYSSPNGGFNNLTIIEH